MALELVAVRIGQLDDVRVRLADEDGGAEIREAVDLVRELAVGDGELEALAVAPVLGLEGRAAPGTFVPPWRDWIAVSWSWSQTSGQPSASAQK